MAKRDPELTARNKYIKQLDENLDLLRPQALADTGYDGELALNAKIGSKFDKYIGI